MMTLLPTGISHPNAMPITGLTNHRVMTRDVMGQKLVEILQIVHTQTEYVAHLEGELQQLKSLVRCDRKARTCRNQTTAGADYC